MKTTDVLRWAAGAEVEPSSEEMVNESELLSLLNHHRLAGRFYGRVQKERPAWCSRKLMIRAWQMHAAAKTQMSVQSQALREVAAKLGANAAPLILLKGASTYALTGDERSIHFSGDVDILSLDLECLQNALTELGYRHGPMQAEVLGDWEFAQMFRGNVIFELHRFFPVWSYPPGVTAADLAPARHHGVWRQNFDDPVRCAIGYDDVREYSHLATTPETGEVRVAGAEMSVLLLCAHILKNVLHSAFYTPQPFRLGELADVRDLAELLTFNKDTLHELANRFGGRDAVRFAGHLMQASFGSNPLEVFSAPPQERETFPRLLSFGCWASLDATADDWLLPLDVDGIVDALGANLLAAQTPQRKSRLVFFAENNIAPSQRALIQAAPEQEFPSLEVAAAWGTGSLDLHIRIFESLEDDDYHYHIAVFCGSSATHQGFHALNVCRQRTVLHQTGDGRSSLDSLKDACTVRLMLPLSWRTMPQRFQKLGRAPLLLQIVKRHTSEGLSVRAIDSLVLLPLEIERCQTAPFDSSSRVLATTP